MRCSRSFCRVPVAFPAETRSDTPLFSLFPLFPLISDRAPRKKEICDRVSREAHTKKKQRASVYVTPCVTRLVSVRKYLFIKSFTVLLYGPLLHNTPLYTVSWLLERYLKVAFLRWFRFIPSRPVS